jgi:hypothetical protein
MKEIYEFEIERLISIASSVNTTAEELDKLAETKHYRLWAWIAISPNVSGETLAKLAEDKHPNLLCNIAWNQNTPAETLIKIAKVCCVTQDRETWYWINKNPNTPTAVKIWFKMQDMGGFADLPLDEFLERLGNRE